MCFDPNSINNFTHTVAFFVIFSSLLLTRKRNLRLGIGATSQLGFIFDQYTQFRKIEEKKCMKFLYTYNIYDL